MKQWEENKALIEGSLGIQLLFGCSKTTHIPRGPRTAFMIDRKAAFSRATQGMPGDQNKQKEKYDEVTMCEK